MNIPDIAKALEFKYYTPEDEVDEKNVKGCYIGDLLSLAMARVECDNVWITIQTNINIVAVASLADAAFILLPEGFEPDENTLERAVEQKICILGTDLTAYQAAVKLAELGV